MIEASVGSKFMKARTQFVPCVSGFSEAIVDIERSSPPMTELSSVR